MPIEKQIEDAWAAHRPYLVDLAFRMLGDIGRAEDVVQEAFARLSQNIDTVDDQRGWLIVVTSRLCLDQIGSARARREYATDVEVLERHAGPQGVDPADRVTLDDSIRLALLVVMERLTPAERVAYVLHDIFGMPFDAVAETVGRAVPTCRQLAHRARKKLETRQGAPHTGVSPAEHQRVTERFIAACANGSLEQLLEVLDPDVSGGFDLRPGLVVTGADRVAPTILTYWGRTPSLVSLPAVGEQCVLAFLGREIAGLLVLTVRDRRVSKIHVFVDPATLRFIGEQLA